MASCSKLTTYMTHDHENVSREVLSDVIKTIQIQKYITQNKNSLQGILKATDPESLLVMASSCK